jgi:hypothetical protein
MDTIWQGGEPDAAPARKPLRVVRQGMAVEPSV